jgi:SAM-dependent methyltransferase
MRKRYLLKKGDSRAYWDENWKLSDIKDAVRFCEISPLKPILDRYFPLSGKILEGGCGLGQFVMYYRDRGYDIEGVDFAADTIARILELRKDLPVKEGNVLNLDYPDGYFSAYYSGGVVEHFEEGPFAALKEAHRVISKDGVFIVSVPYMNLSRRIKDWFLSRLRNRKNSDAFFDFNNAVSKYVITDMHNKGNPFSGDFDFYQYEYTKKEFSGILREAGFKVIYTRPISITWGMKDFKFLRKMFNNRTKPEQVNLDVKKGIKSPINALAKRILAEEDRASVFTRPFVAMLGEFFGNMILFVCKVSK